MTAACIFCGSEGQMSKEHVFAHWLSTIGLADDPVEHRGGPLNFIPESRGTFVPFTGSVRAVCEDCNNGWMSSLDGDIVPTLRPILLGERGSIDSRAAARLAKWALKTALVAMYVSTKEERSNGYGLPPEEYLNLYNSRHLDELPPGTHMWIGRYSGDARIASAWVTPQAVRIAGHDEPDRPQGYAMTILVGEVVLHGFRFTTDHLDLDLDPGPGLMPIWPAEDTIEWPPEASLDDPAYEKLALGRNLTTSLPHTSISPWTPAVDLPESELAEVSGLARDKPAFVQVNGGVWALWLYYLTQRLGA